MSQSLPFVPGSDTSLDAAKAGRASAGKHEAMVLDVIRKSANGATDDEIEKETGLPHQTASARRNGLVRKGVVCDSGNRRLTRSGRKAVVWMLGKGEAVKMSARERRTRPANDDIIAACAAIGPDVSPSVQRVVAWLRNIAS